MWRCTFEGPNNMTYIVCSPSPHQEVTRDMIPHVPQKSPRDGTAGFLSLLRQGLQTNLPLEQVQDHRNRQHQRSKDSSLCSEAAKDTAVNTLLCPVSTDVPLCA